MAVVTEAHGSTIITCGNCPPVRMPSPPYTMTVKRTTRDNPLNQGCPCAKPCTFLATCHSLKQLVVPVSQGPAVPYRFVHLHPYTCTPSLGHLPRDLPAPSACMAVSFGLAHAADAGQFGHGGCHPTVQTGPFSLEKVHPEVPRATSTPAAFAVVPVCCHQLPLTGRWLCMAVLRPAHVRQSLS